MSTKTPRGYWNYERCYEIAKSCKTKKEFKEKCKSAYDKAYNKGWMQDFDWFQSLKQRKWTKEKCLEEAKKYKTRGEFQKNCPCAYIAARKNGWMDEYSWFKKVCRVANGYWTYERCYEEALKYNTKSEFTKKACGAKQIATKNGWIKDYTWFKPPFRWSHELCTIEARKYTKKSDFLKGDKGAYKYAYDHNLLVTFDWFEEVKKPNGYWTKERCEKESRKYTSKKDFLCGSPGAHNAAVSNGWLDDFFWLEDKRLDIIKDKIDSVYVYIFEETQTAYVGRTLMRRQEKRDKEHIFNLDSDNVARYAMKLNIPVPSMKILETGLTLEEGLDREDYWRKWYEEQGYTMLNKLATGIGKGSLGAIGHGKWNKKACFKEARKYKSSHEFEEANGSAYAAACKNGWIKDYSWFIKHWSPKWNKEACFIEAKKYTTRTEFQKGNASAYSKALREGWIDDYYWLHSRQTKPAGYWNNYEHCYEEAKKYKNRRGFQRGCVSGYLHALRNGWLDDFFPPKK